jgi:hypothetical protein
MGCERIGRVGLARHDFFMLPRLVRPDVSPDERIERTVFIRAPRSTRYGEVAKVIDAIKGAGAQPVGRAAELSGKEVKVEG